MITLTPTRRNHHARGLATLMSALLFVVITSASAAREGQPPPLTPNTVESATGATFQVPFRLTDTNHFLVRVRLNGKGPFNFLVDTGAPALFVSTDTAKTIGLAASKTEFWTPVDRMEFEGGPVLVGLKARVEDPFQLVSMNALGLPGASIDGILGFTILARFRIEIDPTRPEMAWTKLDYKPADPFVPKGVTKSAPPPEVAAMNLLGPVAKGMAALMGKQPEEQLLPRGSLGLELGLSPTEEGVTVASVWKGSPADQAGLKPGDRLLKVGGKAIGSLAAAGAVAETIRVNQRVEISYRRQGQDHTVSVTAGEGF